MNDQTAAARIDDTCYLELRVWKRPADDRAIVYRCFQDLASGKFAVQSADFYHLPLDAAHIASLEKQLLELFMETSPHERCQWYATVQQAIAAHDADFS